MKWNNICVFVFCIGFTFLLYPVQVAPLGIVNGTLVCDRDHDFDLYIFLNVSKSLRHRQMLTNRKRNVLSAKAQGFTHESAVFCSRKSPAIIINLH